MQTRSARLVSIKTETPSVKGLILDVGPQGFTYLPGQWIDLFITQNGQQNVLGVSLASAPQDDPQQNTQLEMAVKLSAHPVTAYLHHQAQLGEVFEISPHGMGSVYYERRIGEQVVLIAGGIGITPLLSMFRTVRDHWQDCQATLLYSAADPAEFAFGEEIRSSVAQSERLQAYFFLTGTQSTSIPDWVAHQGRIDAAYLERLKLPTLAHYFLCGPQSMLNELDLLLRARGVLRECIHYESW